jgi:glycosyltransferase involved in cell wall biosynthesis
MRILHLASGNRWTGAAAPAFAEVEALRMAGLDAHYAFVGGYKLEAKIGHLEFAHPAIEKSQNPAAFLRSLRALGDLGPFDVVHAHLTYDHLLAAFLSRRRGASLARTFHSRRVLRHDPFSRGLVAKTALVCGVNETFELSGRPLVFTPPPVDHRQFTPDGPDVRERYGIERSVPVVISIGKLAADRGFEIALDSFAAFRRSFPTARMIVVGHGPHRPALEALARVLAIDDALVWAGYHEDDLAEHYRAADALFFTARGSDEGHRAILEAMACGVVPVCAPIDGVSALLRGIGRPLIAADMKPESVAAVAVRMAASRDPELRLALEAESKRFGYSAAAARLIDAYRSA